MRPLSANMDNHYIRMSTSNRTFCKPLSCEQMKGIVTTIIAPYLIAFCFLLFHTQNDRRLKKLKGLCVNDFLMTVIGINTRIFLVLTRCNSYHLSSHKIEFLKAVHLMTSISLQLSSQRSNNKYPFFNKISKAILLPDGFFYA